MVEGRGQRAEGRRQRAEGRGQRAEGREEGFFAVAIAPQSLTSLHFLASLHSLKHTTWKVILKAL